MSSAGLRLLSSVITEGSAHKLIKLSLYKDLFNGSEVDFYNFVIEHSKKYGAIPKEETVIEHLGNVLVNTEEPPEYYLEQVEKRRLQDRLRAVVQDSADLLKEKNPEEAFGILSEEISNLQMVRYRNNLTDFRQAGSLIKKAYDKEQALEIGGSLNFGWKYLDEDTGGVGSGDFVTFVGRPASGKTFMLLSAANYHWGEGGLPLVVSMEMNTTVISQRLAAMTSHKNLTQLMRAQMSFKMFKSLKQDLEVLEEDIIMLCRQLNPTAVFVDGAYLLRHENNRLNRFDRITENAEALKQRIATDMGIPVVASYQLNREATKTAKSKGDGNKASVDDIYGSDAMAQLSTIVLGLLQHDGVETKTKRRIEILKGRNGGAGSFYINFI
jgi:replicative DNA helicase